MKTIYISIVSFGAWDEKEHDIIYAGDNFELAAKAIQTFTFPNPDQNFAWIELWENGSRVRMVEILL